MKPSVFTGLLLHVKLPEDRIRCINSPPREGPECWREVAAKQRPRLAPVGAIIVAVERDFALREPVTPRFRSEFINFFNHQQFEGPDDEMAFDTFGKIINTANRGRLTQLLVSLQF